MIRKYRPHITLPDGRFARGRRPGHRVRTLEEHRLSDELARHVKGVVELILPYGRADVANETTIWEVEPVEQWRDGVRQVLAYSAQSQLDPALGLFGPAKNKNVLELYLKLRDGHPPIQLWWFRGKTWHHLTGRADCTEVHEYDPPPLNEPDEL